MIETIVIGAGVMGASVAYRLAQAGAATGSVMPRATASSASSGLAVVHTLLVASRR